MVHRPRRHSSAFQSPPTSYLHSSNASLARSPPPGSRVIVSVAGPLTGIDDALKRHARGVDEWRQTMRSLEDARRGSGEYHARSGDLVRLCSILSFFLRVLYSFFQSDLVYQGVQLEEKSRRKIPESRSPQPPAFFACSRSFYR